MASPAWYDELRRARVERNEDVAALSARTGLRVHHIRAIEEGRFDALPGGIYARAAIRTFAAAYGLAPDAVLAQCAGRLPDVEDPIDGIARIRGVQPPSVRMAPASLPAAAAVDARGTWRSFAAATVDAFVTGALLLAASAAAALVARVSLARLDASASLFFVGLAFGAAGYVWLGGLAGTTVGEYALGRARFPRDPRPLTLHAIGRRTLAAATADARAILLTGMWARRRLTRGAAARTAPPPAPSPSPPRLPGRAEALTWSMTRRASVPPPPLRPRHG